MRLETKTRPSRQAYGRGRKDGRSIAQRDVDRFGFWLGAMLAAFAVYIALCETGVAL